MTDDHTVQLNYVIPVALEDLLARYCKQNLVSPSALIRRLILEYVEGDRYIEPGKHPVGRRTTAILPSRLLGGFELQVMSNGHSTKASVIAALLSGFLPGRVYAGETVRVEIDLPVEVFGKVYERYGPGPVDRVFSKALTEISEQELTREAK